MNSTIPSNIHQFRTGRHPLPPGEGFHRRASDHELTPSQLARINTMTRRESEAMESFRNRKPNERRWLGLAAFFHEWRREVFREHESPSRAAMVAFALYVVIVAAGFAVGIATFLWGGLSAK